MRWVGEIGEICFDAWLRKKNIADYRWILEETAGKPDFLVLGNPIGAKTVKRKVPMRLNYTAQITARHAHEPVKHFFFMCYQTDVSQIWFLGGITKEVFLKRARYYGPGDRVHHHYTIREGHEIYNIEISELTPPKEWLESLKSFNAGP